MSDNYDKDPDFDDIIFENRNKEYGAYKLRKKYKTDLIDGLLIGLVIISTVVITSFQKEKSNGIEMVPAERSVVIRMQKLDIPAENLAPPPPPPPLPHHESIVKQEKYVAPQVVDTILPENTAKLMTAEEAKTAIQSKDTASQLLSAINVVPETREEPFMIVQEMPVFPGGRKALMKYIAEHTIYPEVSRENRVQGRVAVKFCITSKGSVNQISILNGVSPELNAEAIRVVKSFPKFIPGKQSGIPVPVWYVVPITFTLQ
jgi:periplasmic protein TonB